MNSALGQLVHLRKSNSMSGHVPVLFMCCEYHFLDTIMNFLFLINSNSNHIIMDLATADSAVSPGPGPGELSDETFLLLSKIKDYVKKGYLQFVSTCDLFLLIFY